MAQCQGKGHGWLSSGELLKSIAPDRWPEPVEPGHRGHRGNQFEDMALTVKKFYAGSFSDMPDSRPSLAENAAGFVFLIVS
jgi:hypothetical protein